MEREGRKRVCEESINGQIPIHKGKGAQRCFSGNETNYSGSAGSDPNIFLLFRFNFCLENSKHINLKNSFS